VKGGAYSLATRKSKSSKHSVQPKTKKHLRSFLGLTNYFRDHISHYANTAFPLTELLQLTKPNKLNWGERQEKAFSQLKHAVTRKPVLRPPNPEKKYLLFVAQSTILMQADDDETKPNYVIHMQAANYCRENGNIQLSNWNLEPPYLDLKSFTSGYGAAKY